MPNWVLVILNIANMVRWNGRLRNPVCLPCVHADRSLIYLDYIGYVSDNEPLHQDKDTTAQFRVNSDFIVYMKLDINRGYAH